MELTASQIEQFDRDGFLIFPDLFERNEVAVLRREVARLSQVQADEVVREHTGGVRTIFRVHETDGATRSQPFRALVRTPRLLRPVQQVLKDDAVYVYHTKINTKPAIEGIRALARERGDTRVIWTTGEQNEGSQRFYDRLGMRREKKVYYVMDV